MLVVDVDRWGDVGGDDDDFGALLSSILPLGGGGVVEPTGDVGSSGFALVDAWALAESLLPGTALALLLVVVYLSL
ncbi:MAG TPA: hypothetical protein VF956_07775 [Candidatus Dormibacteraeota bacterium]